MPVPWQRGHAGPKGTAVVHGSISESNVAKELQTSGMNDLCENQNHIPNLGVLPASQHLRTDYQQKVFSNYKEQLKAFLSTAPSVAIVTDEASDTQDRFGLHILFIPKVDATSDFSPAAYLDDIIYLEKVNAVTVSQAVLNCVANMGISYNNVSAFVSDNASYMSKAFEKISPVRD